MISIWVYIIAQLTREQYIHKEKVYIYPKARLQCSLVTKEDYNIEMQS